MNNTLDIVISTSTDKKRLFKLYDKLKGYLECLDSNIKFIVSYQGVKSDIESLSEARLKFFHCSKKGLSVNRNNGLLHAQSEWVWIQDDDIELDPKKVNEFFMSNIFSQRDIIFIKVGSLEDKNSNYKNYNYQNISRKLLPLKISSIELVFRRKTFKGVEFNESLGLGTCYPSGEENLFVKELLDKGGDYTFYHDRLCFHTTKVEARQTKGKNYYRSKGYLLSFFNPFLFIILSLKWALRESGKYGVIRAFTACLSGYFHGLNR